MEISMRVGKNRGKMFCAGFLIFFFAATSSYSYEDLRMKTWIANLNSEKMLIRKSAARHLGTLGDKRAIESLVEALKDDEAEVRAEVCRSLGLFGEEYVKNYLTNILYTDPSPMVKTAAKRAIDKIDTYLELQKEKKLKEMKEKLKKESAGTSL
jgi:HEAT repeat protein